jgi:hypothetical protein
MSSGVKALLVVVGCLVLLGVACGGFGIYWWSKNGQGLIESGKKAFEGGREFGVQTDNRGCLDESIIKLKKAQGIGDHIQVGIFLRTCLDASRETPGFCEGVPQPTEFTRTAQWQVEECRKAGLANNQQCGQLFSQVQQYCGTRQSKSQ